MKRIDQRENTGTSYHGDLCVCLWQSVCERHVRVDKLMEASGVRRLRGRSRSSRKENWDTSLNVRRNSTALNKTIVLSGQTWNQTHTHTWTKVTEIYKDYERLQIQKAAVLWDWGRATWRHGKRAQWIRRWRARLHSNVCTQTALLQHCSHYVIYNFTVWKLSTLQFLFEAILSSPFSISVRPFAAPMLQALWGCTVVVPGADCWHHPANMLTLTMSRHYLCNTNIC